MDTRNVLRTLVAAEGRILTYGVSCWHFFSRFCGDKFIECASITTFLLMVVLELHRIPDAP